MDSRDDYNRRQLHHMKEALIDFENKRIEFGVLVNKLESLFYTIDSVDNQWKSLFLKKWGVLEDIYAGMLYDDTKKFNFSDKETTDKYINELKALVEQALQINIKTYDLTSSKTAIILDDIWLMCPDCIDAWESTSQAAIIVCPKCNHAFHNPRFKELPKSDSESSPI